MSTGVLVILLAVMGGCGSAPTSPAALADEPLPGAQGADPNEPLNGPGLVIGVPSATVRQRTNYELTFLVREISHQWLATVTRVVVAFNNGGTITFDNPLDVFETAVVAPQAVVSSRRLRFVETQGRAVATSVTITVHFTDSAAVRTGTTSATAAVRAI